MRTHRASRIGWGALGVGEISGRGQTGGGGGGSGLTAESATGRPAEATARGGSSDADAWPGRVSTVSTVIRGGGRPPGRVGRRRRADAGIDTAEANRDRRRGCKTGPASAARHALISASNSVTGGARGGRGDPWGASESAAGPVLQGIFRRPPRRRNVPRPGR
jgi:hypothetical protein